jgi:hypothetical protein
MTLRQSFLGFNFQASTQHLSFLLTPGTIYDLGKPSHVMDDQRGATSWVRAYRGMVHDWCSQHRRNRLAVADKPGIQG